MKNNTSKYTIGQKIVYPAQGVGEIKEISKRTFNSKQVPYYIIYIEVSDMTIMVPCEKVDEIGIRAIVSRTTAANALKNLDAPTSQSSSDWKVRSQQNLDLLKSGNINDVATVVSSLYFRSKTKELPIQERKLFESAKKILIDEISIAMKKQPQDIEDMILTRLEEIAATKNLTKAVCSREEDFSSDDIDDFPDEE